MHCAVVGSPIAHSLSPVMHRAAYRALGLDWDYQAIEVKPMGLADFVASLDRNWRGLSVTAPLKNEAMIVADHHHDDVESTSSANTLVFDDGIHAFNTDIAGARAALAEKDIHTVETVTILGAGATARSMALVAQTLGASTIEVRARDLDKARNISADVESLGAPLGEIDLLISTIPGSAVELDAAAARVVFDVSYAPWPSVFAVGRDSTTFVSGIDLLAHQAALQVSLMTHKEVDVDLLRRAALTQLGE